MGWRELLDTIGEGARTARGYISPWQMLSATDVASYAPGGGMTQAAREQFPRGWQALREGNYGEAAANYAGGALGVGGDLLWAAGPVVGATVGSAAKAAGKRVSGFKNLSELPDLRKMTVDEAVKLASRDPHLIPSGNRGEGFYLGGPRDVQSRKDMLALRRDMDKFVAADPRGADWYDRFRAGISEVTGGNQNQNAWMSKQHGQWSAGVDPGSEMAFALKENNAALAGMPVKAARPAQHEAFMRAIAENNPDRMLLGEKTGEYATKINPDLAAQANTATGVNDFRYQRQWGYTNPDGSLPSSGNHMVSPAIHRFMDYETAAAVGRANKAQLGGRSDWNGEKFQAAPWVRQKAQSLMERNPNLTYGEAFARANTTVADYLPKHTAYATHEAWPGADTGHMRGSVGASPEMRTAFSADPRSTWANAPGGRDAVYSGLQLGDTGVAMRVRPTIDMQGLYTPPGGVTETNPGWSARPLVAFDASGPGKTIMPGDRALLDAGEAVRGYVDAQNASAWHKPWMESGPGNWDTSTFLPMDRRATQQELMDLQALGAKSGHVPDVVDTGEGITVTGFYPGAGIFQGEGRQYFFQPTTNKQRGAMADEVPGAKGAFPASVDSGYIDYVGKWQEGVGSGAATRQMLDYVNRTPEIRAAFNNNPYIPQNALARMERDAEWSKTLGATRGDIQNARAIIGEGPGWVDRLEEGLKKGLILPAVAAAIYGLGQASGPGQNPAQL